jgi:hypothetical protein
MAPTSDPADGRPPGYTLHLVLLGDSIFDNAAYTRGEPDVAAHLRRLVPPPWKVTLLAVDGATSGRVAQQVSRIPDDASHLALAVGGNDALGNFDLLSSRVGSTAEALDLFRERIELFAQAYGRALDAVMAAHRPTVVCTIYNGALPEPAEARRASVALALFNDVIVRAALERGCRLIELRHVCSEPQDYANPIEPSGRGGGKIARALARVAGALAEREPAAYAPHEPVV